MKKIITLCLIIIALFLFSLNFFSIRSKSSEYFSNFLASIFFAQSITEEELKNTFDLSKRGKDKIKILVVPGHDYEVWGTSYRGTKEADINAKLAAIITELFARDESFEVFLARDKNKYHPILAAYFNNEKDSINKFRIKHKLMMNTLVQAELIDVKSNVIHNAAKSDTLTKLYGINKWANDNNFDIVLRIHFNDYPRRYQNYSGKYSGFAIYVPEKQYSNARTSLVLAESVFREMKKYFAVSNMPKERTGIIEDQDLVGVGANNTLDAAVLFIEYGYIYESQFTDPDIGAIVINQLAVQTYKGVKSFFEKSAVTNNKNIMSPHAYKWNNNLKIGAQNKKDVFALQLALLIDGLYPPEGFNKNDCPLTGNFGRCTYLSVVNFQKKYNINPAFGFVGPITRGKLNKLYAEY